MIAGDSESVPREGVPESKVIDLLPPAELWVPPRTQLTPFPEEALHSSSCRRGICRPCRTRSQGSCRSFQPGRERPAVSRGEEEPPQASAGPCPSSWVRTSPGRAPLHSARWRRPSSSLPVPGKKNPFQGKPPGSRSSPG